MFEILLDELVKLNSLLRDDGISLILGGGMGLYLRDICLAGFGPRSPRYPRRPGSRSTEDLDVLLSADIIADAEKMARIRDVIRDAMNYEVAVRYFQFVRKIKTEDWPREVGIDLLTAPPTQEKADDVKQKGNRARPHHVTEIHGRLTPEAAGIEIGAIPIDLSSVLDTERYRETEVYIPSSFNYLILKLHAFHDRKDRTDEKSDEGRHHAFDVFRIVTDMREQDWETAEHHIDLEGQEEYLRRAAYFQRDYFGNETGVGVMSLRGNEGYRRNHTEFDGYIDPFIEDLRQLFENVEPTERDL